MLLHLLINDLSNHPVVLSMKKLTDNGLNATSQMNQSFDY